LKDLPTQFSRKEGRKEERKEGRKKGKKEGKEKKTQNPSPWGGERFVKFEARLGYRK
jgi:hypothetical protein